MAEQQNLTPWADLKQVTQLHIKEVAPLWLSKFPDLFVQQGEKRPSSSENVCNQHCLCLPIAKMIAQSAYVWHEIPMYMYLSWLVIDDQSEWKRCNVPLTGARINLPQWDGTKFISSIVISSAPTDPDCTVIIFVIESIQFCGVGDDEWTEDYIAYPILMDGLVFRGKFYLLCSPKPVSNTQSVCYEIHYTSQNRVFGPTKISPWWRPQWFTLGRILWRDSLDFVNRWWTRSNKKTSRHTKKKSRQLIGVQIVRFFWVF